MALLCTWADVACERDDLFESVDGEYLVHMGQARIDSGCTIASHQYHTVHLPVLERWNPVLVNVIPKLCSTSSHAALESLIVEIVSDSEL